MYVTDLQEECAHGYWHFEFKVDGVPVRIGDNGGLRARSIAGLVRRAVDIAKLRIIEGENE